jgi:hypothetical protein
VKTPAAKSVKKAAGPKAAPAGDLDALVNKHLAALQNAEKALAEAKALIEAYRDQYPELAAYLSAGAVGEPAIHLREDAADESRGSHRFRVRIQGRGPRYEMRDADQEEYRLVEAAAWTQGFKDQLAISIAKIVLAREAAQAPQ